MNINKSKKRSTLKIVIVRQGKYLLFKIISGWWLLPQSLFKFQYINIKTTINLTINRAEREENAQWAFLAKESG